MLNNSARNGSLYMSNMPTSIKKGLQKKIFEGGTLYEVSNKMTENNKEKYAAHIVYNPTRYKKFYLGLYYDTISHVWYLVPRKYNFVTVNAQESIGLNRYMPSLMKPNNKYIKSLHTPR